jgi:hypothetical protein
MIFKFFQLSELSSLRTDLKQLMGIARQLEPYIRSITTVMERIQPEVRSTGPSFEHPEDFPEVEMEKIQSTSKRQQQQQQLKSAINYPVARTQPATSGRQQDFEREHIQQVVYLILTRAKRIQSFLK